MSDLLCFASPDGRQRLLQNSSLRIKKNPSLCWDSCLAERGEGWMGEASLALSKQESDMSVYFEDAVHSSYQCVITDGCLVAEKDTHGLRVNGRIAKKGVEYLLKAGDEIQLDVLLGSPVLLKIQVYGSAADAAVATQALALCGNADAPGLRALLEEAPPNTDFTLSRLCVENKHAIMGDSSVLCCAAEQGSPECLQVLIDFKVDVNQPDQNGRTGAHAACEEGSLECLRLLVDNKADVNQQDTRGVTAVHAACEVGGLECLRLLIESKADVNQPNAEGNTGLHTACDAGNLECLRLLIENKADVNQEETKEKGEGVKCRTGVQAACAGGNLECLRLLIESKATLSSGGMDSRTSMHAACEAGAVECLRLLLDLYKADPNERALDERLDERLVGVHTACESESVECLRLLIEYKADVNQLDAHNTAAVLLACAKGSVDCLRLLIESNADVNILDDDCHSSLHYACGAGSLECLRLLLENNVDVKQLEEKGSSAIHSACEAGNLECLRLLIENNADVDAWDADERTGAHVAIASGNPECLRLLLEHEAGVNAFDNYDHSSAQVASRVGSLDCLQLLIENKADLDCPDNKDGRTGLQFACEEGNIECLRLLIEHKADVNRADKKGFTGVHYACAGEKIECLRLLIESKADVNVSDANGSTGVHEACKPGSVECLRLLIDHKADMNKADKDGFTGAETACEAGSVECLRLLIESRADIKAHGKDVHAFGRQWRPTPECLCLRLLEEHQSVHRELQLLPVSRWATAHVKAYIISCSMPCAHAGLRASLAAAAITLNAEGIDGPSLLALDEEALRMLGVENAFTRTKLIGRIAQLNPTAACLRVLTSHRAITAIIGDDAKHSVWSLAGDMKASTTAREAVLAERTRLTDAVSNKLKAIDDAQRASSTAARLAIAALEDLVAKHSSDDHVSDAVMGEVEGLAAARDEAVTSVVVRNAEELTRLEESHAQVQELRALQQVDTDAPLVGGWVDKAIAAFPHILSRDLIQTVKAVVADLKPKAVELDAELAAVEACVQKYTRVLTAIKRQPQPDARALLERLLLDSADPSQCRQQMSSLHTLQRQAAVSEKSVFAACVRFREQFVTYMQQEHQRLVCSQSSLQTSTLALLEKFDDVDLQIGLHRSRITTEQTTYVRIHSDMKLRDTHSERYYGILDAVNVVEVEVIEKEGRVNALKQRGRLRRSGGPSSFASKSAQDLEQAVAELRAASDKLRKVKYGLEMKRTQRTMFSVAASLPEARIFFPQLSVLNGLGTRVPVRDFVAYKDVQPLEHQGTRQYSIRSQRLILCAQSPPLESGGEEWRDCVLKAFDVEDIKMLRRSVHALSQLSHPNIIPLWSVVENVAEKRWYLEFPHIALDLRAFMEETEEEVEPEVPAAENEEEVEPEVPAAENEEEKTADPNDTLPLVDTNAEVQAKKRVPKERSLHVLSGLLSGVLRGIACLHSHGLIHRDIKPENILLKPIPTAENDTKTSAVRYEPVLIDFETAVVDSNAATPHQSGQRTMMTMMSASTGTAGYMDPEVIRGHAQVTQKSDMYAFGVVMGELLVGRRLAAPADVEACEGVDERVRDMLSNLLSAEGQMRCTAEDLLADAFFCGTASCCVCEEVTACEKGLFCESKHREHFICDACLSGMVTEDSSDVSKVRKHSGRVSCPFRAHGCDCAPYSELDVVSHLTKDALDAYFGAKLRLREGDVKRELEIKAQAELKAEIVRLEAMDAMERKVYLARQHVIGLLELKCPHCSAVFLDFTGCCAVTCKSVDDPNFGCGRFFCGWCLEPHLSDELTHAHVQQCAYSPNGGSYFGRMDQFEAVQRTRRQKLVRQYIHGIGDVATREKVLQACSKDLLDLGITVAPMGR